MSGLTDRATEPIAIIASGCRLPGGCNSPAKLWELLKHPIDLVSEIPERRFNAKSFYHQNAERPGTMNVTKAYVLDEDPCLFDNEFFGISVKEAESMDPQQRIILEVIYECIESAGYSMSQLRGSSTGVFVGQMTDDYRDMTLRDMDLHPQYAATGTARSILANRISYIFDWRGPSLNIDTACSSSLVALHLAVQSLRSGESDMAVVAGVNLLFGPEVFSLLSSLHMISPSAHCRMWDASADGYARGEGFAAIVIKTLSRALADGDDIESLIRNTAMNQDGYSAGLTVPSAAAQSDLIKLAYSGCGLDCEKKEDRCQYFEAHGTGTPTGDPKEAQGLSMAFFPNSGLEYLRHDGLKKPQNEKIYVGSIKTIMGHSEGAAGLASLIKASLAVKNGLIPPNLHFGHLNPDIKPYYHHLEVPTSLESWPKLPPGASRRADVNSFGFGGTNAHVIVESWDNESTMSETASVQAHSWGPFVLSAHSRKALMATVKSLSAILKIKDNTKLHELAWTLQNHRSQLKYRTSFEATSKEQLIDKLDLAIKNEGEEFLATQAIKISKIKILGVFTGQGAQWPGMGKSLFLYSSSFRRTITQLESFLKDIPNPPSWSLTGEFLRSSDQATISSAEISQPLCTALQIAYVDLMKEIGIYFSAVVGHSSGEIAAAYAAGVLNARDAIVIAYYRGYHCHKARTGKSRSGMMMAVGMSLKDAQDFCRQSCFLGKIVVAAENSSSSVTLSGDSRAIEESKVMLDQNSIFTKILNVGEAYHSHHMEIVREPYLHSLRKAGIRPSRDCFAGECNWYSSVYGTGHGGDVTTTAAFEHEYWVENMISPVLFHQVITLATQKKSFNLALEIGPHPALKGSATETINGVSGRDIPYQSTLTRHKDALSCFSNLLGFMWQNFDPDLPLINFKGFHQACNGSQWTTPRVLKDLPPYPWDHDKSMLKESRISKDWRMRNAVFHELLGHPTPMSHRQVRWRNILKFEEIEWLHGHQFQNQILIPASAYLVMAADAAVHGLGQDHSIQLIELRDVVIHNGITLKEGYPGIEIIFNISLTHDDAAEKVAEFSCTCRNADAASTAFEKEVFTGRVFVTLGPSVEDALPKSVASKLPQTNVSIDRFYFWMKELGLQYSDPFLLHSIKRRLGYAEVTTVRHSADNYVIHPATLDSILQGLYAAFSYPGDGQMWTVYLPKSFRRVRFDMTGYVQRDYLVNLQVRANCYLSESSARSLCGDIDIYKEQGNTEIQIEGAVFSSLNHPSAENDRVMFWRTMWKRDLPSIAALESTKNIDLEIFELHEICERTAFFYLKRLCEEFGEVEIAAMEWHFQCLMRWAQHRVYPNLKEDPYIRYGNSWAQNTAEKLLRTMNQQYKNRTDLTIIHKLGSKLPSILRGTKTALQVLKEDDVLDRIYTEGLGFKQCNEELGNILDHMSHRYPQMRVLEIGAGTGGSTATALGHLHSQFESYTFTDISSAFFSGAQSRFQEYESIMNFRVLDIERQPSEQGFAPNSYDLIIAAHVLHATKSIAQTVRHCRELLRPGGYMVLLEITNPLNLRIPFFFSALPGWWLGQEEGRTLSPALTEAQWDTVLRANSFSGVDCLIKDFEDDRMQTFAVMITQAVDERITILRNPLSPVNGEARIDRLLIIGNHTLILSKLVTKIRSLLSSFVGYVEVVKTLDDLERKALKYGCAVICLSDLEESTFSRMDEQRLSSLQSLFRDSKFILWATKGWRSDDPYAGMMVGIARSVSREAEHLQLKLVDVDRVDARNCQSIATIFSEMLLKMVFLDLPEYQDVFWSKETEVAIENGAVVIPRVIPDHALNDGFNSTRHKITKKLCPSLDPINVCTGSEGIYLTAETNGDSPDDPTVLQVLSSSLFSFNCVDGDRPFYICVARAVADDPKKKILTISETNGSILMDRNRFRVAFDANTPPDNFLSWILTIVICKSIILCKRGTIWVHNADDNVGEIIDDLPNRDDIPVFLTTSNKYSPLVSTGKAKFVHARASERECRSLVPRNLGRFANMGPERDSLTEFAASFLGYELASGNRFNKVNVDEKISLSMDQSQLLKILELCCTNSDYFNLLGRFISEPGFKASQLDNLLTANSTDVISWTDVQSINVPLRPAVDSIHFATEKTYFLVGLTGDVGLSLCQWMVDHGCKFLAIASRNPRVPQGTQDYFQQQGVTLRIFAMDVADMPSLKSVHAEIASSMPPIAGVANGALVVRDRLFDNMSLDDLTAVFEPKATGSCNLDELFFSTPLDFFILFGSVSSIVGHGGQANYHAANLFMSNLVVKRRQRGLAASVMQFGMLLGFGYLHGQDESSLEARFRKEDFHPIPEPDFHAVFAQAIISGHPNSGLDSEIIVGLGTEVDTAWRSIPRLSHCRVKSNENRRKRDRENNESRNNEQPTRKIEDRLRAASDDEQALSILKEVIGGRISLALGSSSEKIDDEVGLIRLGLDSLSAVEIRSWLLRVLQIDMPVMRLLSGSSLRDICRDVLSEMPTTLKPWFQEKDTNIDTLSNHVTDINMNKSTTSNGFAPIPDDHRERRTEGTTTIFPVEDSEKPDGRLNNLSRTEFSSEVTGRSPESRFERIGDMSHAQSELFLLHGYLQNNAYNVAYYGQLTGQIDMQGLQKALWVVGMRHEALRSAYFLDKSTAKPVQAVLPQPHFLFTHRTISSDEEVQHEIDGVKDFKFEIERGILLKVSVMSHSPNLHTIVVSHHHIAFDAVAWNVVVADLVQAYAGNLSSSPKDIPQSIDMVERKANALTPEVLQDDFTFWKDIYGTIPEPLPLFPFAKSTTRPAMKDYNVDWNISELSKDLHELVLMAAARIGVTPFHFYLASFATFLSRCLGIDDLAIGVVNSSRTSTEDVRTVGHFLDMLPVRIILDQSEQFDAVARQSHTATLAALTHSHTTLDSILSRLGISRSTSHHPLFQVAINYRKSPSNQTDLGTGKIVWNGGVPGGNPYDMLLNIAATPNSSLVSIITQRNLYWASDGVHILKWYTRALEALARDPGCEIRRCPVSNTSDIEEAKKLGVGTSVEVPWEGKITDRIDMIAGTVPDTIAIRDEDGHCLTYTQMIERTLEIARHLQSLPSGTYVGMILDPVADAICCILAILRLNLVWIPLDTRNHPQRLQAMVEECRPQVLIHHEATYKTAKKISERVTCVQLFNIDSKNPGDIELKEHLSQSQALLDHDESENDPAAMILYTSGSTGKPKGVLLTHRGIVNQIYGTNITFHLAHEVTLQQSPLGFDLMLDQIFLALTNGGTIIMVGKSGRGDPKHIAKMMVEHGVTLTHFVPSEYSALLNYGHHLLTEAHSWRYAMSGGEKLTRDLRQAFRKLDLDNLKLVNVYGPAEITLACARGIVPHQNMVDFTDYLRPSPNYSLHIMDTEMNVMPIGFPGEICIFGQGVGLGYFRRPEESAAKFVQKHVDGSSSHNVRFYRSGDKGRILPNGTLEVLGRLDGDSQVKINGVRVELDEIANAIVSTSKGVIVNASASLRKRTPSDLLVAFVVFDFGYTGEKITFIEGIRSSLPLPAVMKPTFIVPIEKLPTNANGKIDRNAVNQLPVPEVQISTDREEPTYSLTPLEEALKLIWEEVLTTPAAQMFWNNPENSTIHPNSDFFQMGGTSILMIKLKALIEIQFGVALSMPDLFHASTLRGMAVLVEDTSNTTHGSTSRPAEGFFLASKGTQPKIDWDIEVASLADGLHTPYPVSSPKRPSHLTKGLIIVLTGATGFIGRHILSKLVQQPRVAQVHCLAIRPDASGAPRHVSVKSDKIIEYTGDLSAVDLGLSQTQYSFLAEKADCIIHNGADVSLLKTYQSLRRANVLSTRTLCQLATAGCIPLHYVSTASVAKAIKYDANELLFETPAFPAVPDLLNSIDGYAASKWVSETLIDRMSSDAKLPAYIHRLAHVVGNDASELDAVGMMVRYSIMLRALPRIDKQYVRGQWDFVTVQEVAKDLVDSVIRSTSTSTWRTTFLNHCSSTKVPHDDLKICLEEMYELILQEIDMQKWLELAREKGLHPLVHDLLSAFQEGKGQLVLPLIAKGVGPVSSGTSGQNGQSKKMM